MHRVQRFLASVCALCLLVQAFTTVTHANPWDWDDCRINPEWCYMNPTPEPEPPPSPVNDVNIIVNGKPCLASPIVLRNSSTYVPLRAFSGCMGFQVDWSFIDLSQTQIEVSVYNGRSQILLYPSHESPIVKLASPGTTAWTPLTFNISPNAPYVINGTTMIPFRVITDAMDVNVEWIQQTRTVKVDTTKKAVPVDMQKFLPSHFVRDSQTGYHKIYDNPSTGYPFSPAAYRTAHDLLTTLNGPVRRELSKAGMNVEFDVTNLRFRVRDTHGEVSQDYYLDRFVLWFRSELEAEQWIQEVERQAKIGDAKAVVGSAVGAYLVIKVGLVSSPVGTLIGSVYLVTHKVQSDLLLSAYRGCIRQANIHKSENKRPSFELGVYHGPSGVQCILEYTDSAIR
jgi:hypothetical protein